MIGKVVLPYLGGTPQVWNTCMVFFQAALLGGYLYSHEITRRFGLRKQLAFHFILLLLPLAPLALLKLDVGPIAREWFQPPTDKNPIPWLLGVLTLVAGLPFFVVATSAPLLQKWYADTGAMGAKDPYFLYGASNLGSMLALVAYPTIIEPKFALADQAKLWVIGYAALLTLTLLCGLLARLLTKSKKSGAASESSNRPNRAATAWEEHVRRSGDPSTADDRVPPFRWVRWVLLAFVPSSLMLGATTYVTTDVAPVPLLWIIPLTLYLLSFILVFTRLPRPFPFLMFVLLIASVAVLLWPKDWAPQQIGELRELPLAEVFPLQLGPVLSKVLAVQHLLVFVSFCLVCLLLPRVTHAVMVLLLPVLIIFLTIHLYPAKPFEFNFFEFVPDETALFKWTIERAHYTYFWHSWSINALHFLALFVAAMVCHGELARTRPSTRFLTAFYLCMSIGGVLGGLFNGMVAPVAFNSLVEYPLVIALACLLAPRLGLAERGPVGRWVDLLVPAAVFAFGLVAGFFFLAREVPTIGEFARFHMKRLPDRARERYRDWERNLGQNDLDILHTERGFFGVLRVRRTIYYEEYFGSYHYAPFPKWDAEYHSLLHGNIDHGQQRVVPGPYLEVPIYTPLVACTDPLNAALAVVVRKQVHAERRRDEPVAYFQQSGPIGDLFAAARVKKKNVRIGVLGMGTGSLAGYAEPGWQIDYYEIDPAVVRIAYDENYFTYLPDAERRGVKVEKHLGDGRLQIQKNAPDGAYDLLFMDAFSSDSVPVHLLTKEAVEMYLKKLAPGGIIIVNIANRYLDFRHIFGNLAKEMSLASLYGYSRGDDPKHGDHADLYSCDWVLLARQKGDFGLLNDLVGKEFVLPGREEPYKEWKALPVDPRLGVWTDDFSNLLSVFDWNR